MRAQSQIQRTLGQAVAIERVAALLSQEQFDSRGALGSRVCAEFDFLDHQGRPQLAGCLKALRNLEQSDECRSGPSPCCGPQPVQFRSAKVALPARRRATDQGFHFVDVIGVLSESAPVAVAVLGADESVWPTLAFSLVVDVQHETVDLAAEMLAQGLRNCDLGVLSDTIATEGLELGTRTAAACETCVDEPIARLDRDRAAAL